MLELVQVSLSVEEEGVIVAFKVRVLPFATVALVLFNFTLVAGTFTVTLQVAFFPPDVFAVIVTVPFFTAVTTPFLSTVATFLLELLHVTLSVAFLSRVAFSCFVAFCFNVSFFALSLIPADFLLLFTTVTLQVAFFPLVVLTVIVAVPVLTPLILPLFVTVTTFLFDVDHVSLSVAVFGNTDAVSFTELPFLILIAGVRYTLVAGSVTVILQVAFKPFFVVAVIVAVPAFFAVTFPFASTFTTEDLEDFHFTDLSVQSFGVTVAFKVYVFPFFRLSFVLFNLIFAACT